MQDATAVSSQWAVGFKASGGPHKKVKPQTSQS